MAWNMMGGEINFSALPLVCEIYGIADVEQLLSDLIAIRNHKSAEVS